MIEHGISLASNGVVKVPGYEPLLRFGYTKNRGVYRLAVTASGEWEGLTIRAFWHTPGGKDPASSLIVDGFVNVPASVTAQSGNGCITFEGSDGTKTVTSADLRYRVSANSGTEDGAEPEPGTPAWQQLVDAVHTDATTAEQAKTDAQTAAQQAEASAKKAGNALSDIIIAKEDALKAIGDKQTAATQAVDTARDRALQQVETSTKAAQTAASEAAASAGNAIQSSAKSSAAASNANTSAENAARAQVAASQLAGQAADSATKAAASHQAAESNAAAAQESATKADASASTAVQGQQRAEAAATRAETAQQQTESASTDALDKISSAKTDALKALDTKQTSATTAVESAKGKALDAVTAAQSTATRAVQTAQTDAVSAIEKAGSEVLKSIPEDYQTTVEKVGELKTEKAEIDDATVGFDAWSSKHIVDMLCPPISETGNPVQCYPVAGYPLGCKVSWGPTQEGSGDPSPDNVRPIKGRDSVSVERCGENLIKFPYYTPAASRNGLVMTSQQDGSVTINGTATAGTWLALNVGIEKRLPMNTPMTLSGCPAGGSTKSYYIGLYLGGKWFADVGTGNTDIKFTTREIVSRVEASIVKGTVCNNLTFYPKIEVGTSITPYSKYTGQTATLTLPRTIYGGTVDAVTGEGKETWKLVTLDGTTNKFSGAATYWNLPQNSAIGIGDWYLQNIHSSHFPSVFGGNARGNFIFTTTAIMTKYFQNADALNAYLAAQYAAGTPVQIAYKLATPTPITATGAQPIPALSGVNTLLTDADSVTVTGRADPIKRITDLEDAVASMTTT